MNRKIVLASGSPRRRELMDLVGAEYIVIPSDRDEDMSEPDPKRLVEGLSKMKAEDVAGKVKEQLSCHKLSDEYANAVIIGCDTVVAYENKILGKPHTEEKAFSMIKDFAGKKHEVYTGVCIIITDNAVPVKTINYSVSTSVYVSAMSDEEIRAYIATGESLDKAGAYAIQGRFAPFIERIEGDYYNIVGYPLNSIYNALKADGILLF